MKIQIGEVCLDKVTNEKILYENKTKKYILPCLKEYGEEFMNKLNNVFKVAAGIGDMVLTKRGKAFDYEKHVFILLDSRIAPHHFDDFIVWIKRQPMYQDDYVYDNIQKSHYHMVVLRFPEKFYESFHTFKQGKYSEMFDKENLPKFFEVYPSIKKVLIKDHKYSIIFANKLNKIFKADINPEEYEGELDLPPTEKTDIFNHHLK